MTSSGGVSCCAAPSSDEVEPELAEPELPFSSIDWTVADGIEKPIPSLPPPWLCDLRVHADDFAARVQQRTAGVAGVDRGVGLDHVRDRRAVRRLMSRPTARRCRS